jgi:hypothetical protein
MEDLFDEQHPDKLFNHEKSKDSNLSKSIGDIE